MALTVRPARPGDKPALMAIARRVWDGDDYLPVFFDRWVKQGDFWVGVLHPRRGSGRGRSRVIGCGKATHFGRGEWWLEGLRIEPDLQGRGFGTRLSFAILGHTLAHQPRSLRLSTAEVNRDSIHIIGRMGFAPIFATRQYRGRPPAASTGGCRDRVIRTSASAARSVLADHAETWLKGGLLSRTWKFRELTPGCLGQLELRGRLLGVREHGRLAGLLIAQPHLYDPRDLDLGFVAGTPSALAAFRRHLARRLAATGGDGITATASSPAMQDALARLGLLPERGFGRVIVFEYIGGNPALGRGHPKEQRGRS